MATGTMEYGSISPETAGYLSKKFLKRALANMPFEPFVSGVTLPGNETKVMRFRRWTGDWDTAVSNMYLTEGVVPLAQQVSMEDVTVTLKQMGGLMKLTDVVNDTHTDPVLNQMFEILGEQGPRLVELDRFYALRATTNKYYANGTARTDVNTVVTTTLLKKATRNLERNLAAKITKIAKTSPDFNTENINPAYIGIGHIDLRGDVEALTGFTFVKDYPANVKPFENEVGSWGNIRFILGTLTVPYANGGGAKGTMISTSGTSADVYPLYIFGQMAWDSVALKGQFAIKPTVVSPNTVNHANPLAQFGFCGWKTMQATIILNDKWNVLLEVAATEL